MKKILIISILLLSISAIQAQTNSLYFTKNIFQTTELNPARQLPCNFSLGLPVVSSVYLNLLNKDFDYSSLFVEDVSGNFSPDLDGFYNALNGNNYIFVNNKISLGNIGVWIKDFYVFFDVNLNNNVNVGIPKSLFIIKDGNYFEDDNSYFSATDLAVNVNSYVEYGLGISKEILPGLTIGGKFKVYTGITNLTTSEFKLDWKVSTADTSNYEYTMTVAGEINSSAWLSTSSDTLSGIDDVNFSGETKITDFINEVTTTYKLPFKDVFSKPNLGIGMDFGVIYKLNNQFEFSASVIDFGFINWQNSPLSITIEEKDFIFSGLEIGQYLGDSTIFSIMRNEEMKDSILASIEGDMIDTLLSLATPTTDSSKYRTPLNTKLYFAAAYSPTDWFSAGFLYNGIFFNNKLISSYTLSTTLMSRKGWSYSINYTMFKNSYNNLGMGVSWKILGFQTYLFLDNISIPTFAARYAAYPDKPYNEGIATKWIKSTRMVNLHFGINILLGCKKQKDYGLID
ncbi:MAG: DUF5723 family protein [Bacteroidota bacterium]|nr:DUF5723 family protein [Bacteroidota bacterium]